MEPKQSVDSVFTMSDCATTLHKQTPVPSPRSKLTLCNKPPSDCQCSTLGGESVPYMNYKFWPLTGTHGQLTVHTGWICSLRGVRQEVVVSSVHWLSLHGCQLLNAQWALLTDSQLTESHCSNTSRITTHYLAFIKNECILYKPPF